MAKHNFNGKIKSKDLSLLKKEETPLNLITKPSFYPRSYRWQKYDLEVIDELLSRLNGKNPSFKLNTTSLLRGALFLAQQQSPEKLYNAIVEAERRSLFSKIK